MLWPWHCVMRKESNVIVCCPTECPLINVFEFTED
jgi:hypothetical protein